MNVTSATAAAATPGKAQSAQASLATNFDNFLQLLTKQLQYQDPLSPMDTNQFTQQLVSFTGVEQSIATNQNLESLIGLMQNQNLTAATGYIGKVVTLNSASSPMSEGNPARWSYDLDGAAAETKLTVLDQRGVRVFESRGETQPGEHSFTWDGKGANGITLPAGAYTLRIDSTTASGAKVNSAISITELVEAVETNGGAPQLLVRGMPVDLSQVNKISQPRL
jgi:flagellar basal-body rod modification protein FlgD